MLDELKEANLYIKSKIDMLPKDERLSEIEKDAEINGVPIVTPEVAEYLKFCVESYGCKSILEIGTATGYSGIILAKAAARFGGNLTTIEIDEERYNKAQDNFNRAEIKNVKSILGDASEVLEGLNGEFDFVFIDASKGQYMDFFNKSYSLTKKGGIIFIDNIMFRGFLYQDEYPKRYKTIVKKLNMFIEELYKKYNFVLLPFGDGVGLVRKI